MQTRCGCRIRSLLIGVANAPPVNTSPPQRNQAEQRALSHQCSVGLDCLPPRRYSLPCLALRCQLFLVEGIGPAYGLLSSWSYSTASTP
jgi:hypothetical protein